MSIQVMTYDILPLSGSRILQPFVAAMGMKQLYEIDPIYLLSKKLQVYFRF